MVPSRPALFDDLAADMDMKVQLLEHLQTINT
jgi:hypothetical protein